MIANPLRDSCAAMRRSDETPRRPGQEGRGPPAPGSRTQRRRPATRPIDAGSSSDQSRSVQNAAQDRDARAAGAWARRWFNLPPRGCPRSACPSASPTRSRRRAGSRKHEARRRQMQFIGRLMRDVDPAPIRAQLAHWGARANCRKGSPGRSRALARAPARGRRPRSINCAPPLRMPTAHGLRRWSRARRASGRGPPAARLS